MVVARDFQYVHPQPLHRLDDRIHLAQHSGQTYHLKNERKKWLWTQDSFGMKLSRWSMNDEKEKYR